MKFISNEINCWQEVLGDECVKKLGVVVTVIFSVLFTLGYVFGG